MRPDRGLAQAEPARGDGRKGEEWVAKSNFFIEITASELREGGGDVQCEERLGGENERDNAD